MTEKSDELETGRANEPLVAFIEGWADPKAMQVECPVCAEDPGVWCQVAVGLQGQRIGFLHEGRVERAK